MEFTSINGTSVSRIGLGTWAIGGLEWGAVPEDEAIATCLAIFDHGINLIDAAPAYGRGHAEQIIGQAIGKHGRRDSFYIATKCGLNWPGGKCVTDAREEYIRGELEKSLRLLGTDYIDLYQVHWPDPKTPVAETAALLESFRKEGKIRALGVSNFSATQMAEFLSVAPLHSDQPPYNLFERAIEADTLPFCREHSIAVLTYSSLCRSLLAGRLTADSNFPQDDIRRVDPKFQPPRFVQYLAAVARLDEFALKNYGRRVLHLAARWVLDRPGVSVALWGAKRPEQLAPVEQILGWKLDDAAMKEIDRIVAETVTDPVGPEYLTPGVRD